MSIASYGVPGNVITLMPLVTTLAAGAAAPSVTQLVNGHLVWPVGGNANMTLPNVGSNTMGLTAGQSFVFTVSVTTNNTGTLVQSADGFFTLGAVAAAGFVLTNTSSSYRAVVTASGATAGAGRVVLYPI